MFFIGDIDMASYSADFKKLVIEQLIHGSKSIDNLMQEHKISRHTLYNWKAQYLAKINALNESLEPSNIASSFSETKDNDNGALNSTEQQDLKLFGFHHSKVEGNNEIIKLWCLNDHYEHKTTFGKSSLQTNAQDPNLDSNTSNQNDLSYPTYIDEHGISPDSCQDIEPTHQQGTSQEQAPDQNSISGVGAGDINPSCSFKDMTNGNIEGKDPNSDGYYREFTLAELFQSAVKAQVSLWHGPKCDDLCRFYGISIEQLRSFYHLVQQEGLVSGSLYNQMQHQVIDLQEQLKAKERKIQALEAKENLYRFYLDAFKKQSSLYKLDFNTLNEEMKSDFLKLINDLRLSGMTTQEAAELIGINMRTYYRWVKASNQAKDSSSDRIKDNQNCTATNSNLELPTSNEQEPSSNQVTALINDNNQAPINKLGEEQALANDHDISSKYSSDDGKDSPIENPLKATSTRPDYKFISDDEFDLIKELLLLDEYQGLKVRDCYEKLKNDNLITMSLSTFYRMVNKDPTLKAAIKKPKGAKKN